MDFRLPVTGDMFLTSPQGYVERCAKDYITYVKDSSREADYFRIILVLV